MRKATFLLPSLVGLVLGTAKADIPLSKNGRHRLGILLDLRLGLGDKEVVSRDRGIGALRLGGQDNGGTRRGDSRQLRPFLGQLGLEFTGRWSNSWSYLVSLNSQLDGNQRTAFNVPEIFLSHETGLGSGRLHSRLGFVIPPFSMENPGQNWSTFFTLTPSAINAWLGEEVRSWALESTYTMRWSQSTKSHLTLAGFLGGDPSGVLLSWRGWAMHDLQAGINDRTQFAGHPGVVSPTGFGMPKPYTRPFLEMNDKPGWYGQAKIESGPWKGSLGYWGNQANPRVLDKDHVYGWATSFQHLGLRYEKPDRSWLFQTQVMDGHTRMGGGNPSAVENDFRSYYFMASTPRPNGRWSLRYDHFQVDDRDRNKAGDLNGQRGKALTLGWNHRLNEESDLVAEWLYFQHERPMLAATGFSPKQQEHQFQLAWRHYR